MSKRQTAHKVTTDRGRPRVHVLDDTSRHLARAPKR